MTPTAPSVLSRAAATAQGLPPLMVAARHLADTVQLGDHGRRRAGQGDAFWQFRPAQPGDPAHRIDWRRSARSDQAFIRDREWQAAQTVMIWCDPARSMAFSSDPSRASKSDRAKLLALAAALLFLRAGERVGFPGSDRPPLRGEHGLPSRLTDLDKAPPRPSGLPRRSRALFLTDGLADPKIYEHLLGDAASSRIRGAFIQVLDPAEERFPFAGRSLFLDMQGDPKFETQEAADLRAPYLERLAGRKKALAQMCRDAGWVYHCHDTITSPSSVLLWLYHALGARR
ncbi:DUF58 domain-containing protein [Aliiroseovarius sp. KMU-50]|uniref:DUF58 domain-containing protein n=1 Tax=Aliiroseovarius salicola TaxID=3009082 RepID=A0ABT4VZ95_9RHOB|nr:DUF58 domain-containing protein [Aliiroseovarius sp. KMU-50]MDA5093567.1 DUF58 domain-containing protein [Aliiroseovarius sp. KMU-50]